MSNLRQAAQQALEAMDNLHRTGDTQVFDLCHRETTEALRAALAEPVNFCPRCGKRAYPDTIHTCTPPAFMG